MTMAVKIPFRGFRGSPDKFQLHSQTKNCRTKYAAAICICITLSFGEGRVRMYSAVILANIHSSWK
jgi:hypothetical protein